MLFEKTTTTVNKVGSDEKENIAKLSNISGPPDLSHGRIRLMLKLVKWSSKRD